MSPVVKQSGGKNNMEDALTALRVLLDHVDYIAGNCGATNMVGAVVSPDILKQCREIAFPKKKGKK